MGDFTGRGTMSPRRKNANKPAPVTASQSEGHGDSEASGSEVQINVTPEDHSPRATRSLARRAILQDSPPQSGKRSSSSENGQNSGIPTDTAAGNQSADDSGDSAESDGGSQADTSTSPPVATIEAETGVREETVNREDEEEITDDDTMVMYVNAQEPNPTLRPQLIACYRSMWTVNRSKEFFDNGIVNKTGGIKNQAIMSETRVVVADVKAFSDIYRIFQLHQFDWMDNAPGEYSSHLTREFYSSYAATLMNFAADTETTKRGQKDMASTWDPLNSIIIAKQIAIDGENAGWVTTTSTLITKASLSFPAKVWWAVVQAQLRPTANDNTLSPSLASLVACLMVGYPVNARRIIAIEMRDRALNERAALPFPCLIGKLCRGANIPPNSLVDRWGETFRLTQVSKIKDVANYLFGAKSAAVGTLVVVPHVPLDIFQASRDPEQGESSQPSTEAPPPPASASQTPGTFITIPMLFLEKLVADQRQTKTLVDQIVLRMPQLIETKVLAVKKEIKDEKRTELSLLNNRVDGLENLVQDRFQATGSADTEEFRTQLAELCTQIAKLAEKPAQVPTPVMPESLMQMLSQAPSTQTLDDLWGAPPTSKSGKRKHIAGELDEETPTDSAREARRQEKRARRASKREVREKEALDQQQRDATLVGASGSGEPASTNENHTDHVPRPESAPIDKGGTSFLGAFSTGDRPLAGATLPQPLPLTLPLPCLNRGSCCGLLSWLIEGSYELAAVEVSVNYHRTEE
uniref:Putative plant transposon protein domain-containing protein n=1 Tax=Solanum tuberosum TaxID=4113 RepID=M1DQL5_SOLTU